MEQNNFEKRQNRNLLIVGIICLVGIIGIVGYTYSYFQTEGRNTGTITGTVASASLSVEVEKLAPDVDKALVPQLDTAIEAAVVGTQGNCIDDNHNAVCQVYSITVQNTSSITINVDGLLELNASSNPNLKWTLIDSYADGMTTRPNLVGDINPYTKKNITTNEAYAANETKTYYLVLWISETGYVQADTGVFTGTVTFKDHEDTEPALATLTYLQSLGFEGEVSDTELTTFTTSSKLDGTTGIYAAEDDLGTSYYFRGNIVNNYVSFAGMSWRIMRINGDGTVRMIYEGTTPQDNNSTAEKNVGHVAYNTNYNDNAYVGYMYGTVPSTSYAEAHTNTHNSTVKTFLEGELDSTNTGWYYENIESKGYGTKVADAIYCNDREISTVTGPAMNYTTDGFGTAVTAYKSFDRITLSAEGMPESYTPSLKCEREEDRFTKGTAIGSVTGNAKLKYPVALATFDELVYAGAAFYSADSSYNEESYMYEEWYSWTMSPAGFNGTYASVWYGLSGAFDFDGIVSYPDGDVRPVLSLNRAAITGGTGTKTNPFTVS